MRCLVCNQNKEQEELAIFSYGAYIQIFPLLTNERVEFEDGLPVTESVAVHVCKECLLNAYQPAGAVRVVI